MVDPSGAAVAKAAVTIHNAVTRLPPVDRYRLPTAPSAWSIFPPNPYHLEVTASGFAVFAQDVAIRSAVPVQVKATLALAGAKTTSPWKPPERTCWRWIPRPTCDADRSR